MGRKTAFLSVGRRGRAAAKSPRSNRALPRVTPNIRRAVPRLWNSLKLLEDVTMIRKFFGALALAGMAFGVPAAAATVSATNISNGTTTTSVSALYDGALSASNVFVFSATAGASVDLDINRLAAPPDLYAVLRFGDIRGTDIGTSTFTDIDTTSDVFGTSYVDSADDTEADALGGPYGDPRFTFVAGQTGTYSLFVIALDCCSDPGALGSPFEVVASGIASAPPAPVPLPAGAVLLVSAIGALMIRRRNLA
jgi:hypothetical protein